MSDYLSKPVKPKELASMLIKWLHSEKNGIDREHFAKDVAQRLASMQAALAEGSFDSLRLDAQSIRSAATHLGATRIAAVCSNLEQERDSPDPAKILSAIEELKKEFAAYEKAMHKASPRGDEGKVA